MLHYFLIIYLFSTPSIYITEFNTLKECKEARKIMVKELQKDLNVEKITCEKGYIFDEYDKYE